ncbi:MAG: PKD domain-containing protein [Clostridia bacterium]|nr:PKD domain-containing protein [Clostridia bacterium]
MKTFTKPKNQTHTPALVLAAVFSVSISVPTTPATAAETMGALKSMSITDAQAANKPPLISFKTSVNGATITFDATGSTDPDGTIQEYKWDFGDGSTGSGATISHTFSADPAPVTLTAIDDKGGVAIAQTEIQGYTEPFEIIVDDADSSRFTTVGAWAVSTSSPGYYNTGYKTAPAGTGSSVATWAIEIPKTGEY